MLDPDVSLELLDGVGEEPAAPVRAPQRRDGHGEGSFCSTVRGGRRSRVVNLGETRF